MLCRKVYSNKLQKSWPKQHQTVGAADSYAYVTASEKWARTGSGSMFTNVTVARNLNPTPGAKSNVMLKIRVKKRASSFFRADNFYRHWSTAQNLDHRTPYQEPKLLTKSGPCCNVTYLFPSRTARRPWQKGSSFGGPWAPLGPLLTGSS